MNPFQQKLAAGRFVVTAEVTPPLTAAAADLVRQVAPLAGLVDAINVTDAASARPALSTAAAAILAREGFEPICQLTCRDRNRIALISDLLGASAQGSHVLILHGDDPKTGDMPEAKPVYDLNLRALMSLIRAMRDQGALPSGPPLPPPCSSAAPTPPSIRRPAGSLRPSRRRSPPAPNYPAPFCFDVALADVMSPASPKPGSGGTDHGHRRRPSAYTEIYRAVVIASLSPVLYISIMGFVRGEQFPLGAWIGTVVAVCGVILAIANA